LSLLDSATSKKLLQSTALPQTAADPLKRDFRNFLYVVWKHLNLPEPTPLQYDIAYYLQHSPTRCVIEAFRGVGKSWITSAFVVWLLYCNPQLNILVVSATKDRADQFSTFVQMLILDMELLAPLRPKDGQRFSKIAFDVGAAEPDHAPSVKSAAIFGQLAGSRADIIVADDIEVPNNSDTQTSRDKLSTAIKEFDAIIKPMVSARIIYLGTPQSEQSIYNLLPARGYQTRIWPARMPSTGATARYGERLAPFIAELKLPAGSPTEPRRFTEEDLLARELSYGKAGFTLQFMLDTSLTDADKFPLKLSDLICFDLHSENAPIDLAYGSSPELALDVPNVGLPGDKVFRPFMVSRDPWAKYAGIVMAIDPSGRGGDETGYAVVAFSHGRLFLLDAGGLPGGYDPATLRAIANVAKVYKVNKVVIEPNFGDGMYNQLLAPVMVQVYPCSIEETERSKDQKEKRIIDVLEPVMAQHRLVVDKGLFERDYRSTEHMPTEFTNRYRLFYQMTRITRDRGSLNKDDRIDALALAVHYWIASMAQDTRKMAEAERQHRLDRELVRFLDSALGNGSRANPNTWKRVGL